jgi:hypothetical protein
MGLLLISCGGGKSAFAGKWYLVEKGSGSMPRDVELLKDGTGFAMDQELTWKTESKRFYITHPSGAMAFDYKLSGSRLDLSDDDGGTTVYMKKLGGASALAGTWEFVSYNGEQLDGDNGVQLDEGNGVPEFSMVLEKDGSGTFGEENIKWISENDTLYMLGKYEMEKGTYQIKGDVLTLTQITYDGEEGDILEFKKKK